MTGANKKWGSFQLWLRARSVETLGSNSMEMLICPLCNEKVNGFHKRSHLIPEWMYTDCYDENHKALEISKHKQKATRRQKGIYSQFICEKCEMETQRYDHYASLILTNKSPEAPEYKGVSRKYFRDNNEGETTEFEIWENLDFRKFQRFALSVILRTQLSGKMGGDIRINKQHLNKITKLYRDDSCIDDISYPILAVKNPENDTLRNQVILPYITKHGGHHIIEFAGAGFIFNIYVSSHKKPKYVNTLRLKTDGSMFLLIMFFRETGLYRNTKRLVKAAKSFSIKR